MSAISEKKNVDMLCEAMQTVTPRKERTMSNAPGTWAIECAPKLLLTLKRIRQKADTALREDGGKWAVQTLDAIDEIAEAAIADAESRREP